MVKGRLNFLISGGTGAGKTTLLNVLSGYIPNSDRIVTIEDAAELQMKQEHVVRLETRPPNIEGKGAVRQRQLVINSLRMRPDRIVVGEVRGEEAFDMLQAMNTGHEGSLTTVHANTPRDALARIENMCSMANLNIPERAMRHQIAAAIHAVVQVSRLSDGTRKVVTITEVTGMEGDVICMQDIFTFDRQGIDETGKVKGVFKASGIRPKFAERLATAAAACVRRSLNRKWRFRFQVRGSQPEARSVLMFILIAIAVFVVVALGVFVVASLLDERSSKARLLRDRLSTVQKSGEREPSQELALLRDEVLSKIPALDNLLRRSSSISNLQTLLEQADVKSRAGNVLLLCFLSGAGLGIDRSGLQPLSSVRLAGPDHRRISSLFLRQLQSLQTLFEI